MKKVVSHWNRQLALLFILPGIISYHGLLAQGNVGIGKANPFYTLDIVSDNARAVNIVSGSVEGNSSVSLYTDNTPDNLGQHYNIYNDMKGSADGIKYGVYNNMRNTGGGDHFGLYQSISGVGQGIQTGIRTNITNSGDGNHIGSYHILEGSGNGIQYGVNNVITNNGTGQHFGVRNQLSGAVSNVSYGVYNLLSGGGTGTQVGVHNLISNSSNANHTGMSNTLSGNGDGQHKGIYNNLGGSGNGLQYGVHSTINNAGNGLHIGSYAVMNGIGTGSKYAIYGQIGAGSGGSGYAGYFNGDVVVTGIWSNPSDARLKRSVTALERSDLTLDKLDAIEVVGYEYNREEYPFITLPAGRQTGFIAQQIATVFPDLVNVVRHPVMDSKDDNIAGDEAGEFEFLSVNYVGMIPYLLKGMQEQQEVIEGLEERIRRLEN